MRMFNAERARTPLVSAQCQHARHHVCPQNHRLADCSRSTRRWIEWYRCTCECHEAQQQLFEVST